jgi:hypothetical protein
MKYSFEINKHIHMQLFTVRRCSDWREVRIMYWKTKLSVLWLQSSLLLHTLNANSMWINCFNMCFHRVLYCHVYGGMGDDNNGFFFGWFDLLALRLQVLLITLNYKAIAILHTFSSPLHTHWDSHFPLISPSNESQHRNYHFKSLLSLLVTSSSITLERRPNSPILIFQSLYCTVLTYTH